MIITQLQNVFVFLHRARLNYGLHRKPIVPADCTQEAVGRNFDNVCICNCMVQLFVLTAFKFVIVFILIITIIIRVIILMLPHMRRRGTWCCFFLIYLFAERFMIMNNHCLTIIFSTLSSSSSKKWLLPTALIFSLITTSSMLGEVYFLFPPQEPCSVCRVCSLVRHICKFPPQKPYSRKCPSPGTLGEDTSVQDLCRNVFEKYICELGQIQFAIYQGGSKPSLTD